MLGKPLVLLSIVVGAKLMWPKDDLGNLVNLYFSTHSLLKFPREHTLGRDSFSSASLSF